MPRLGSLSLFLAGALAGSLLAGQVKSPDDRPITAPRSLVSRANSTAGPIAIDELFYTRNVAGPSWSPDGKEIVFTTNLSGRLNLWKVAASGGWPVQLSQSDDRELAATWSPDGKWILYQQDYGGGEYYDLFAMPANGGEPVNVTNTKDISETDPLWSPNGAKVAFARKLKTSAVLNIAVMDWPRRTTKVLTQDKSEDYFWRPVTWSHDGRYIFSVRNNVSDTDASVYRIDCTTGKAEELTPHHREILYSVTSISPDGKTALISSNEKDGFSNVALLAGCGKILDD